MDKTLNHSFEPLQSVKKMTENLNRAVQKFIELKLGDQGRLQYIYEMLQKEKPLPNSDKQFVESLISKYVQQDSNNSNDVQYKNKIMRQTKEEHESKNGSGQNAPSTKCNSMTLSLFQQSSQLKLNSAILIARIGLAITFLWAGFGKASDPVGFGEMLQNMMAFEPMMATNMALIIGILELSAGVLVLLGFITRPAAVFQIIVLIGGITMFGFDLTAGPALWKDTSLIGLAMLLVIYGAGKFSVDNIIAKKISKT